MKKILYWVVIGILLLILSFSFIKVIIWFIDHKEIVKETTIINNITNVNEVSDDGDTEIIDNYVSEKNPYWDYIKMPFINVDFNLLKEVNSDTVGWIYIGGTNINYPVVKSIDNNYYLKHSFYKEKNNAGWIFMDYRNDDNFSDANTIIYGHGRVDKTMFGTLKNLLNSSWLNNQNNYIVKYSSLKKLMLFQIFSVYTIATTNDYLYTNFVDDNKYQEFLDMLKNRSAYNFNTDVNFNDKIITLSTCYNESQRVVMHAKLIKITNKK